MFPFVVAAKTLLVLSMPDAASAFNASREQNVIRSRQQHLAHNARRPTMRASMQQKLEDDIDDELDELSPPSISFTKNSILFDDNAPTEKRNGALLLWQETKSVLPSFVTGARKKGDGDREPVEYLYNMVFVRFPVVLMGIVYVNNLLHGHGLYITMRNGEMPFEVPVIIVFAIIYVILR